jgi:aminomethyltransferase
VLDVHGAQVRPFLRKLIANSIDKLQKPGKALYSCMLDEHGGVIDDLIVYFLREDFFRVVVNAATRDKDLAWIEAQAKPFGLELRERRDLAMVAVQGPKAREKVLSLLSRRGRGEGRQARQVLRREIDGMFVARTGYTARTASRSWCRRRRRWNSGTGWSAPA